MRDRASDLPLAVRVLALEYKEKPREYTSARHAHAQHELVFTDRGRVGVIDRRKMVLEAGELAVLAGRRPHSLVGEPGPAPNIVDIVFACPPSEVAPLSGRKFRLTEAEREVVRRLVREEQEGLPLRRRMQAALLAELLLTLRRRAELGRSPAQPTTASRQRLHSMIVEEARHYIAGHLDQPLSLESIAAALKVSTSALAHAFSGAEGQGLMHYVRRERLAAAKALLRDTALSVGEVAQKVGFSSIHYFSRVFKSETGYTPSGFARSVR